MNTLKYQEEDDAGDDDIPDIDINGDGDFEEFLSKRLEKLDQPAIKPEVDYGPRGIEDTDIRHRLKAVEAFYVSFAIQVPRCLLTSPRVWLFLTSSLL